jgi:hypothetical protein
MSFCYVCPHCERADAYSRRLQGNRVYCSLCEKPVWLPILSPGLRELEFSCPVCRQEHRVFLKDAGKAGRCLHCKVKLIIPSQVYETGIILEERPRGVLRGKSNETTLNLLKKNIPKNKRKE